MLVKGKYNMSYKGELQTLTKLNMRHQVCPSETCLVIISESILTMYNHEMLHVLLCHQSSMSDGPRYQQGRMGEAICGGEHTFHYI